MKKINDSKEIVIGKEYLYEEIGCSKYFKSYPIRVKISKFDGMHFWSNVEDKNSLSDNWIGYDYLCIGAPEQPECNFYEIED